MKIAVYHNLPSGGAKRALYEWIQRLVDVHQVDVYTLSSADHAYLDVRPWVHAHHVSEFVPQRLFGAPFRRLNQLQYRRNLDNLVRIAATMADMIDEEGYDVVFLNPCQYTYMPALASFLQTPSLYYLHEPFGPTFQRSIERPYLRQSGLRAQVQQISVLRTLYLHRLEDIRRRGMARVACLLANSEFTQKQIEIAYHKSSVVCPYGVDSITFLPMTTVQKEHAVISVGAMTPRKGFDFLIESLALIPRVARPVLKIASNGVITEEADYIKGLAGERGVEILVFNNLDSQQLCMEYNKALLCVYSPVMEPFGLVPLEAMACGIPVVGVREGGVAESVVDGRTGILTERNPALFAAAVQNLLADPIRIQAYGVQARDYVLEDWTWERSTAVLEQQLAEVAQTSSTHGANR